MAERNEGEPLPIESSMGLPVVTPDTVAAIQENYTFRESWGNHLAQVQTRLISENPHLVRFIESQVGKFPSQLHTPLFEVFAATIAVLEHQASANKLEDRFRGEQERK